MGKKGKGKDKGKKGKKEAEPAPPPAPACPAPDPVPLNPLDPCPKKACDIEAVDDFIEIQPNHYPSILKDPAVMAVAGSEDGSYESLCKLLRAGLRCAERVFVMTPWGNYVVMRARGKNNLIYFLFDGCTCDVNRFRYLDLSCGTAGFLHFDGLDDVIKYIIHSRGIKMQMKTMNKINVNDIVEEYGSCQFKSSNKCMRFN